MFIDSQSEASLTVRFEKEKWKNEHGTETLTNAEITLTADPSASIRIGVEAAKNDSNTIANRKAIPAGVTFVDDSVAVPVPGSQLEAGSDISVWIEFTRGAGAAGLKSSFTTQLAGTTI